MRRQLDERRIGTRRTPMWNQHHQVGERDHHNDRNQVRRMQSRQPLTSKTEVVANRVTMLVQTKRDDETRDHEENMYAEPSVLRTPLQPRVLTLTEVVPAHVERGESAQCADDPNLRISTWRHVSGTHP